MSRAPASRPERPRRSMRTGGASWPDLRCWVLFSSMGSPRLCVVWMVRGFEPRGRDDGVWYYRLSSTYGSLLPPLSIQDRYRARWPLAVPVPAVTELAALRFE